MFIALRDLRRSWTRFLLVGLVVLLVALLTTVLGALANGLQRDGISALQALPFDHMAFEQGSKATFSRSTIDPDTLATYRQLPDVEATPLGVSFANAKSDGDSPDLDIALFGVESDSFLVERPEGHDALAGEPGLVLSADLADEGIAVGDQYTFSATGVTLPVLGFTFAGSYGHVAIAYTPLETWQELTYGSGAEGRFSAIALQLPDGITDEVHTTATGTDTEVETKTATYDGSPGYTAEQTTMTLIRGFLLVISALVVGAFFTVLIVQRTRQVGLLKAMGASTWYVVRDGLAQMIIVVTLATLVGTGLGAAIIAAMSGGAAPVALVSSTVFQGIVLLIVAGIVGSLVPLRRIAGIEPAIALGSAET